MVSPEAWGANKWNCGFVVLQIMQVMLQLIFMSSVDYRKPQNFWQYLFFEMVLLKVFISSESFFEIASCPKYKSVKWNISAERWWAAITGIKPPISPAPPWAPILGQKSSHPTMISLFWSNIWIWISTCLQDQVSFLAGSTLANPPIFTAKRKWYLWSLSELFIFMTQQRCRVSAISFSH